MSIESTYKKMLLEEYLKTKLQQGTNLSAIELIEEAEAINETYTFGLDTNTSPQSHGPQVTPPQQAMQPV